MKYKYSLCLSLMVAISTIFSHAQERSPRFSIGFNLGAQIATLDKFGEYQDWSQKSNYKQDGILPLFTGAFLTYKINNWLSTSLEGNFVKYGGAFNSDKGEYALQNVPSKTGNSIQHNYVGYKDRYKMIFFEIPLFLRYTAWSNRVFMPYAEIGFSYGILLNSIYKYNSFTGNISKTENWNTNDIYDITEKYSINYQIGTGFNLKLGNWGALGLNFRYINSLTRVFKYDQIDILNNSNLIERLDMVTHYHAFRFGPQLTLYLKNKSIN